MMVNNFTNFNNANNSLPLHSLDVKQTTTYDVWNAGLYLGQAQQCGGVKLVNGIPKFPPCIQFYFNHKHINALQLCTFVIRMLLEILSRDRFPSVFTFNLAIAYTAYYISSPMNQYDCFLQALIGKLIIVVAQIIKTEQSASREITQHTKIRSPFR